MVNSKLYRRGAIKKRVPHTLVLRYYFKRLLGTCGAWFLSDFITFPNAVLSATTLNGVVKKDPNQKHPPPPPPPEQSQKPDYRICNI
ncbi:hypothetical protein KCV07_g2909, partial [Aureobasidium melanogenum]